MAGLTALQERLFGKLSSGERQRLMFALALCGNPDLLFLDEPTTGLDVETRLSLWQRIRWLTSQGRTVLLATHRLEEADALSDRIIVINKGQIIADGPPAAIKAQVAHRRIRCTTRLPIDQFTTLPEVRSARRAGEALELLVDRAEPVVYELLTRDPEIDDLEVTHATLEDAFLALTGSTAAAPEGRTQLEKAQ